MSTLFFFTPRLGEALILVHKTSEGISLAEINTNAVRVSVPSAKQTLTKTTAHPSSTSWSTSCGLLAHKVGHMYWPHAYKYTSTRASLHHHHPHHRHNRQSVTMETEAANAPLLRNRAVSCHAIAPNHLSGIGMGHICLLLVLICWANLSIENQ